MRIGIFQKGEVKAGPDPPGRIPAFFNGGINSRQKGNEMIRNAECKTFVPERFIVGMPPNVEGKRYVKFGEKDNIRFRRIIHQAMAGFPHLGALLQSSISAPLEGIIPRIFLSHG
jgi:hypothetical protein